LVGIVDGEANVHQYEQITAGKTIRTGPNGHVEVSVGWEAFLRLDENSTAVLESVDRPTVAIRLESGAGLIEVASLSKKSRIVVTSGSLKTVIDSKGIFRFSADTVSVFKGKLQTVDKAAEVNSGWEITNAGGTYRRTKLAMAIAPQFKQFMSRPKAGFVNAVEGEANVRLHQQTETDKPVQTGPGGRVELLLGPGSFLRLGENSAVVIESNKLTDITMRVLSGTALLESVVIDSRLRTHVKVGPTKVLIGAGGLYRFTAEAAAVLDGALQIELEGKGLEYRIGKGRQILGGSDAYQESDIPFNEPDELDRWSARRSYESAAANFMAQYGDASPNFFVSQSRAPNDAAWIYSPRLNGFTFIPRRRHDSYYKHTFVPLYVFLPPPPSSPNLTIFPEFPGDYPSGSATAPRERQPPISVAPSVEPPTGNAAPAPAPEAEP
jgi:hypothetical protein